MGEYPGVLAEKPVDSCERVRGQDAGGPTIPDIQEALCSLMFYLHFQTVSGWDTAGNPSSHRTGAYVPRGFVHLAERVVAMNHSSDTPGAVATAAGRSARQRDAAVSHAPGLCLREAQPSREKGLVTTQVNAKSEP